MTNFLTPAPLFNPITAPAPLSATEIFAGPFGLLLFLPLIPLVLLLGRRWPRATLIGASLVWMLPTLQPSATLILLAWLAVGIGWVLLISELRRRNRLCLRSAQTLIWIGLHALALPLWLHAQQCWYPSRMAPLHNAGFAYFLLRMVGWGLERVADPQTPARLADTACWLLYPACMRLGPVVRHADFLTRLDQWQPTRSSQWRRGGLRGLGFIGGGLLLAIVGRHIPLAPAVGADFFAAPQDYSTTHLLRAFYLVPIQIYLLLWTYNELACAIGYWVGIPVDNNFNWLPRATSVRDFWRRWHVTVGAWLRDYLYIPLGGNRRNYHLNLLIVFAYCGLWHGASWSFLAWGLSQALALNVQHAWDHLRRRTGLDRILRGPLWTACCWLLTMHYQLATVLMFSDFDHCGLRLLHELAQRTLTAGA